MNIEQVKKNVEGNKELMKYINAKNYFSVEDFIRNAERYVKAIKDRRMACIITSISNSGMSGTLKFIESNPIGGFCNFYSLFEALGYKEGRRKDGFIIRGEDMVFNTNYSITHTLKSLGIISEEECKTICQLTPTVF